MSHKTGQGARGLVPQYRPMLTSILPENELAKAPIPLLPVNEFPRVPKPLPLRDDDKLLDL